MPVVENNCLVELSYRLTDVSGAVLDASEDGQPYTYMHGRHEIIPALEAALTGLSVGDEQHITLPPEEAYGQIDPTAVAKISKHSLPREALVPGTELTARKRTGETMFVTVKQVLEDSVVLDLNHPFAGKTLHFHLRVVQIVPQPD